MTDDPSTLPPRWAESLLRTMLRPQDRESISGDLLEEYRQSIVPALGARADRWYVRQVGWYVLRTTLPWAALVGAILVGRYLLDTLVPTHYSPGVIHPRSTIMSWALIATYALGGCWQAWRTARLSGGVVGSLRDRRTSAARSAPRDGPLPGALARPADVGAIQGSGGSKRRCTAFR